MEKRTAEPGAPFAQGDLIVIPAESVPEGWVQVKDASEVRIVKSALGHHHVLRGAAEVYASIDGTEFAFRVGDKPAEVVHQKEGPDAHATWEVKSGTWVTRPQIQGTQSGEWAQVAD